MRNWEIGNLLISRNQPSMRWQFMHISSVSNAKNRILEVVKTVPMPWMKERIQLIIRRKNLFAQTVARFLLRTARNMERTLYSLNVNSVAQQHSGSVGVIPISVNRVISGSALETMWASILKINYQNVQVQENARLVETTTEMGNKELWVVQFAETIKIIVKDFDFSCYLPIWNSFF